MTLSIDIATDIYPIHEGQQLTFQLVSSLRREKADGETVQSDRDAWRGDGGDDLSADFDYVMYGKVGAPNHSPRSSSTTSAAPSRLPYTAPLAGCSWHSQGRTGT